MYCGCLILPVPTSTRIDASLTHIHIHTLTRSGTIAEASTRGLPVMLFNFLPGQEEGNVPFVVENGFGDYKKDPKVRACVR